MKFHRCVAVLIFATAAVAGMGAESWVRETAGADDFPLVSSATPAPIVVAPGDFKVVAIAVNDLVSDLERITGHKPAVRNFEVAFERIGVPRERILHVAQSLFHDHVPAKALGMTTVWIDRREGRGGGASPDVEAHPDARFTSMAAFADAAFAGAPRATS